MPKAMMLVFSNAVSDDREADYNEWYDGTHVPDILKVPGINTATRFKIVDSPAPGAELPGRYLAIYEVEAGDLNEITENLGKAFVNGELPMSDVIEVGPIIFFQQVSETQTAG